MRATLSFELPEEQAEFTLAVRAGDLISVLCELRQDLRSHLKYGETFDLESAYASVCEVLEGIE